MTEEQRKIYTLMYKNAKNEIESEIKANGYASSKIKILSILTRIRQICSHPGMFVENYSGGSGKLNAAMEIIEESIDSGHSILLFSQFTKMLSIIKEKLDQENYTYFYLDGSTKPEYRLELSNRFNKGEKKLFLISLKAGGTGLNLTGADTVIHFDPGGIQLLKIATDRAYRIGQKTISGL